MQNPSTKKIYLTLVIITLPIVFGFAIYSAFGGVRISKSIAPKNTLKDGLVGHWTFDGKDMNPNVRDISGQGNHGNLSGQTSTTTTVGKIGQALDFDGVDDYVDVGNDTSLDVSNLTISAWIKTTTSVNGIILGKSHVTSYYVNTSAGEISFWSDNSELKAISTGVNNGEWHQVLVTFDGSTKRIYLDGTLRLSGAGTVGTDTNNVQIGESPSFNSPFKGTIDDVRIYNRALSASEITQLYNSTKGNVIAKTSSPQSLKTGLVGHWTFDGKDMLTNVADSSGQDNHGNLSGQTSTTTTVGKIGQALDFDGVDDYVDFASQSQSVITISAWVKSDANGDSLYPRIIEMPGFFLIANRDSSSGNDNSIEFASIRSTNGEWFSPTNSLPHGQWFHVAVSYNSSSVTNNPLLYIDGINQVATEEVTPVGSQVDNAGSGQIGNRAAANRSFDGSIDDVRIYNRALSAEEITQLYNSTKGNVIAKTSSPQSLKTGLVGHWTFDGKDMLTNVADSSGQDNHGNLSGQTSTTTTVGKIGQALDFDGVDDYVDVGTWNLSGSALTLSAWFKTDTIGDCGGRIISKSAGSAEADHYWMINVCNDDFRARIKAGGSTITVVTTGSEISVDTWYHGVATYDGANVRLYIDGIEIASSPKIGTLDTSANKVTIGRNGDQFGGTNNFNGTIDDVRIYNRTLSALEISQLYNLGR